MQYSAFVIFLILKISVMIDSFSLRSSLAKLTYDYIYFADPILIIATIQELGA
jgi:hypothetical protein